MAKKGNTVIVKLRSSESDYRYYTTKNKKNTTGRMEIKKYDPIVRKHVAFQRRTLKPNAKPRERKSTFRSLKTPERLALSRRFLFPLS